MDDKGTPIYWLLFWKNPTALNSLDLYQKRYYGCHIEKPPEPKQRPQEIPVNVESEELERILKLPPLSEGRGY